MHHDVGDVAVGDGGGVVVFVLGGGGGVGGFAAEEDAGVGVHGGLVGWDGAGEFPHDDGFGVVDEVFAYAG